MLHNTGTFSQNEVPINPNDQVNLSSQNDNISSNNNLSKTGHQPPQALPFNDPEYNTYGINMNAGLSQFHNTGLQTNTHTHENWPNNMSPMNLNVQNEQSLLNFHGLEKSETNIDFKGHCAKKTLNMPPVYTKAYHKQMDIDYNYYKESYSLVNYDMNHINNKSSAKTQFVKENLDLTAQNLALSDAPSLNNEYNRIGTTLEISYTKTETDNQDNNFHTLSQESSCYELDLSNKPVPNIKTENISHLSNKLLKDDSRKQLEKKVKMIENIISHPSNSRKIKMEEENFKSEYSDSDLDLSDTSDQDFFSNSHKTSKTNNNVKLKKNQTKTQKPIVSNKHSVTKKAKHKKIKIEILANNEDSDNNRSKDNIKVEDGVVVKAEMAPTTLNIEQFNPFLRDTYGVHIEETKDCDIIGAENSINVAKEIIKNGSSLKTAFFECPHCKLFFNNVKRFLIHTKWHTFGYITEKKLRSQKEKIVKPRIRKKISEAKEPNDNEEGGDIPCADCKRTFNSTLSLSEHRRKYHPTRVRECKICAKTVVGMTALRTHIATHTTTDSKFQCTDCPKWFKYAHSLAKHRDTHLEKTHECSQCPKKFGSVALLNVHMKTHERVLRGATFRCTYCGKGFFESYSLQAHERTHRNERPYICEICNTSFGTNSSLKRHLKVESNSANKFETQCILDTQLINLIENEEAAINLKNDIKKTDNVPKYMTNHDTKNNDFQRNNVIQKCSNKPDAPLTFVESVDFKTSKNMSSSKEIQMNNAVNSHCNENNYKALEDGYENRITNNSINDNDVFNDSDHSFDYKLETPSSPILGIKLISKLQPLIYTLEEFDKFESLAAPVLNGNTDFEDAKRIINSQLKSADLFVKTHSEIVTTGKDVESVDSTDLFVNTQSGIVTTGKKIQSVDGTDLFVNTLSEMVTTRKDIESDFGSNGTEISVSTHSEIISSDKEIKSIAGTIKNETKIVNNIPKTQYSFDINSGINNNVIEDEILFDSDDDIKYSEELPLTCALETSFYNNTEVLDKTMYVGFQTASNQSIQVLSDSFKKAKTVFDNVTKTVAENLSITELVEAFDRKTSYETDDVIKKNNKNDTEIIRTSKSITPEIYNKEENPNLHKNTTKKQITEHIDEHIMKEFENNLMLCEDNATIESTCKRKMKNFCHEIGSYSKNYVEKDILEISVDKNNLNRNSFPNLIGFKTASNKKIKISHQALTKTKNIFDDIDLNNLESEIVPKPKETNNSFVGFKTANNKIIKISAEAVLKTKKIFDNIDTEYSVNCQTVENLPSIKQNRLKTEPILNGFGNSVSLNMEKSASFPAKETELEDVISTKINKIDSHGIQHKVANPLKTANNKTEVSSDNGLEKNCTKPVDIEEDNFQNGPEVEEIENKLYEKKEEIENNLYPVNKKTCLSFKGFKTANNETIDISAEALLKTKKVFQDIENKNMLSDDVYTIQSYMSHGFKTANKKPVVVSQETLSKPNMGQDVKKKNYKENLALSQGNTVQDSFDFPKFDGISKTDILKQSCFGGFHTASNKNVQISEEALIKSKKIFKDIDLYKNKDTYESDSQFKGFCTASNKKVNISEEALVKTGKIFENLCDDNRYCEDELKKNIRAKLKNNVNIVIKKPDTHESKKIIIHEENKITESKIHVEEFLNTEMIKIFDESLNTEDFFKETTPKSKRSGSPILSCSRNKKKKFQPPKKFYKIIHTDNKNIKPLNLFKFDENYKKSKKYKLTDIVTEKSLNSFENIDPYLFNFNFDRLLDFRFENNRNEIDSDSWTTYKIKNYFTDSVNKKIIPDGWIDNHLKLIIWKLISYEMISPSYMKYACSVKNVLQQLKYRYDRELYNVERPALRKILEKDDVSTKFMILCVASFYVDGVSIISFTKENKNIELLLTDGWYCVTASADSMIDKLIIDGKISIGTKLAIYGAELTNCEQGISPLEDTSAVRLKISGNSIKRAKWDARLGFQGNGAMMSRLKTVKLEGGKISKLRVFVTRVYPTMYVEKFEDGSTVTRSERLEHLHQMKCETEKQIQMEELYDEVVKMTEQDTDDSEEQYTEQENLDTGSQISRLMKKSKDPIEFKSTLTISQAHMLNEHMNRQNEKLMENIQKKAQILIKKRGLDITRNVVPLMKVRVFDEKKAMITIWRPNESLFDLIKEGAWIDVYNVVPTSIRYSEIQISAGRQSIFCKSKFKEIDRLRPLTQIFKRNCYTIKDLQSSLTTDYNEVDTVGIVFLIEPKNYDGSKELFQNVYLSGTDKSIISVNFWGGVKKFGFENILEVGQIVACVNLQKRAGNTRYILQYRATEYTYFTKTPKYDLAKKLLEEFSAKFVKMDKNKMIQDCIDLKNNYLNFKYSNTENVSPYRMNNSEYNISRNKMFIETPLLDKDFNSNLGLESNFKNRELSPNLLLRKKKANDKIAKLTEYGETPPLNHIHIINKSSKVVQPYKSPLISDISPSVANTNYININNVTSTSNKISSPVLNRTFVKINPVKLNFALEENNIAEELNSPPLSLDF